MRLTTLVAAGLETLGASTSSPFARASIIASTSSLYLSWKFSGSNCFALIVSMSIFAIFFSPSATFSLSAGKSNPLCSTSSSLKCISSSTSASPLGFTAAMCSRERITTRAIATLPESISASRSSA